MISCGLYYRGGRKMQEFIAYGRVAAVPVDAVGKTGNGHVSFKFEFVCSSSLRDENGVSIPSYFHVQVYGKQAEVMAQSLVKGSPILVKGEMIQKPYLNKAGKKRIYQYILPSKQGGITFLESKEAADKRRQEQISHSYPSSDIPDYLDVEEPF